jgi:hypothetical protein
LLATKATRLPEKVDLVVLVEVEAVLTVLVEVDPTVAARDLTSTPQLKLKLLAGGLHDNG